MFSPKIIRGFLAFFKSLQKECLPINISIRIFKEIPKWLIGYVKLFLLPI